MKSFVFMSATLRGRTCPSLWLVAWAVFVAAMVAAAQNPPDSSDKDRGLKVTKSGKEFLTDPDIERWAVVVGISEYKNSDKISNLKYADKDAQAFYDFLISDKGGSFKKDNIKLLLNEKATSANLRKAFGTFLGKTADNDLVVIFIAGHGAPDPKKTENIYVLTYDSELDSLPDTAYPMWDLDTALQRFIKAGRVIIFADTCHSAGIADQKLRGDAMAKVNKYFDKIIEARKGCTKITSCSEGEYSQEDTKWGGGHGVFTHFLLEGLTRRSRNQSGCASMASSHCGCAALESSG